MAKPLSKLVALLMPKRRWTQFSLATLLVVVSLICVWLAVAASRNNRKLRAIAAVEAVGGSISYDYQWAASGAFLAEGVPPGPQWMRFLFCELCSAEPVEIQLFADAHSRPLDFTDAEAAKLGALSELRWLVLMDTAVTDAGLQHLRDLGNLERLDVEGAMFTDAGVNELQRTLPNCKYLVGHLAEAQERQRPPSRPVASPSTQVVPGMGTAYREKVSDDRLRAVCEHVRVWLFGKAKKPKPR